MLNISQISEDLRISRLLIISLNLEGRNATLVILSMKKKDQTKSTPFQRNQLRSHYLWIRARHFPRTIMMKCNLSNSLILWKKKFKPNQPRFREIIMNQKQTFPRTIMIKRQINRSDHEIERKGRSLSRCCYLEPGDHIGQVAEAGHLGVQLGLRQRHLPQ